MSSGLVVFKVLKECYRALFETTKDHVYRYVTFVANLNEKIFVDKKAERENSLDDLLDDLPPNDSRYVLYEYDFVDKNGKLRIIPLYIIWMPNTSRIKVRMLYYSCKYFLLKMFEENGVKPLSIRADSPDDLEATKIQAKCESFVENLV